MFSWAIFLFCGQFVYPFYSTSSIIVHFLYSKVKGIDYKDSRLHVFDIIPGIRFKDAALRSDLRFLEETEYYYSQLGTGDSLAAFPDDCSGIWCLFFRQEDY
jgi:hypothetical protein